MSHPAAPVLTYLLAGDGKCPICDSYVRPATLVRVCDECNYGSYAVSTRTERAHAAAPVVDWLQPTATKLSVPCSLPSCRFAAACGSRVSRCFSPPCPPAAQAPCPPAHCPCSPHPALLACAGALRRLRRHRRERRLLLQGVHHLRKGRECCLSAAVQEQDSTHLMRLNCASSGWHAWQLFLVVAQRLLIPLQLPHAAAVLSVRRPPSRRCCCNNSCSRTQPPFPLFVPPCAAGRLPQDHQPRQRQDGPVLRAEKVRLQKASVIPHGAMAAAAAAGGTVKQHFLPRFLAAQLCAACAVSFLCALVCRAACCFPLTLLAHIQLT